MVTVPTVVIAAPASGTGKTTVATGIVAALAARGTAVAPFKVGPDFIDPGYHALAAGRPGRNLDPVLTSEDVLVPLLRHGARGAHIAVVEGVMGLFDGRIETGPAVARAARGSTAHVAAALGAPVVLVVDGSGHSQSLAALLHGFATFDPSARVAGVILNRVGSERHEQVLRAACEAVGLPVLGALPRAAALAVPSRHLGLVPAAERAAPAVEAVAAMGELAARHLDLDAIVRLAATAVTPASVMYSPADAVGEPAAGRPVVAVAGGPAFTFGYAEHRELLTAAGADVVAFDPLGDPLPPDTAAVVVGGGFPEEHAAALADNDQLRRALAEAAASGMPIHAECAGLTYLCRSLDGHPMVGALDAEAVFTSRLTLGYRDAVALTDSPAFAAGTRITGHEFHRTVVTGLGGAAWGWSGPSGAVREGAVVAGVHASYLHTHPVANPAGVARFVRAAAGRRRQPSSDC